ncbi:MAG: hypothetical protein ACRD06_08455, partial [Terriglobia bacterium]
MADSKIAVVAARGRMDLSDLKPDHLKPVAQELDEGIICGGAKRGQATSFPAIGDKLGIRCRQPAPYLG